MTLEPGSGELPVAHDGVRRDLDGRRRFVDGEAAEETQFDDAALALVEGGQRLQRIVEGDEVMTRFGGNRQRVVETGGACHAAALGGESTACMIDENLPHHAAAQRQEVQAIVDGQRFALDQPEERFVDESSGLERVTWSLMRHVMNGDPVKFAMNERNELVQRRVIAATPSGE